MSVIDVFTECVALYYEQTGVLPFTIHKNKADENMRLDIDKQFYDNIQPLFNEKVEYLVEECILKAVEDHL